jgi:RNA polymerase sigma factor (sigma-70 family)
MHEPLARIIASERQTPDAPYDDLAQEARIQVWLLANKRQRLDDNLRGLASVAMRRRINEVATRQTWTGYESHRGYPTDPMRSVRESMDAIIEAVGADVFGGVEALRNVEMAYHHGEIQQALDALPDLHRQYVSLRFWSGWTQDEIAVELQTSVGVMNGWWARSIRPALRQQLAHLGAH